MFFFGVEKGLRRRQCFCLRFVSARRQGDDESEGQAQSREVRGSMSRAKAKELLLRGAVLGHGLADE